MTLGFMTGLYRCHFAVSVIVVERKFGFRSDGKHVGISF